MYRTWWDCVVRKGTTFFAEPVVENRGRTSQVENWSSRSRVWGCQTSRRAKAFRHGGNSIRPHSTRNAALRFHEGPGSKVSNSGHRMVICILRLVLLRARMKHNLNPVMNAQLDRNRRIRTHRRNLSDPRFSTSLTDSLGEDEVVFHLVEISMQFLKALPFS